MHIFLQTKIERNSKGNEASSSNPSWLHSLWNDIWSAQVPPKIKTFVWKACNDSFVLISFSSIPLHCNCAALALANATKVKEEVIIWLEECPSFLFLIVQSDLHQ